MSTYTDLHTRVIKENVSILRKSGEDDGITLQRVIFANNNNVYYGTFKGPLELSGSKMTDTTMLGGKLNGTDITQAIVKYNNADYPGEQIVINQIADEDNIDKLQLSCYALQTSSENATLSIGQLCIALSGHIDNFNLSAKDWNTSISALSSNLSTLSDTTYEMSGSLATDIDNAKNDAIGVASAYTNEQINGISGATDNKINALSTDFRDSIGISYDENNRKIVLSAGGLSHEIDATDFIKDGMLNSVELLKDLSGNPFLRLIWNTFNDEPTHVSTDIDLNSLVDVYTASGDGIKLSDDNHTFYLKYNEIAEGTGLCALRNELYGTTGPDGYEGILTSFQNQISAISADEFGVIDFDGHLAPPALTCENLSALFYYGIDSNNPGVVKNGAAYSIITDPPSAILSVGSGDDLLMLAYGDVILVHDHDGQRYVALSSLVQKKTTNDNGNVYVLRGSISRQEFYAEAEARADADNAISAWLSSNFGNTGANDNLSTTILNYDVSATKELSVAFNAYVFNDLNVAKQLNVNNGQLVVANANTKTSASITASKIELATANEDDAVAIKIADDNIDIENAKVSIAAIDYVGLSVDGVEIANATSSEANILSVVKIDSDKAAITKLSADELSITSFDNFTNGTSSLGDVLSDMSNEMTKYLPLSGGTIFGDVDLSSCSLSVDSLQSVAFFTGSKSTGESSTLESEFALKQDAILTEPASDSPFPIVGSNRLTAVQATYDGFNLSTSIPSTPKLKFPVLLSNDTIATSKDIEYVQNALSDYLPLSGGNLTGDLSVTKADIKILSGNFSGGENAIATGKNSFAYGSSILATGDTSFAIGSKSKATAIGAHAEGFNVTALHVGSHAAGRNASTTNTYQWVWNGATTQYNAQGSSTGTFNINPVNDISGFYIGTQNLASLLGTKIDALDALSSVSATYTDDHHIYLSANGQVVGDIDCADFIKDGMLSSVELCSDQLIFKFNTDADQDAISVALSDFIDETNYYQKSETSSASEISDALDLKQDNLTDAQNSAIDSIVVERQTVVKYNDDSISAFDIVGEIAGDDDSGNPTSQIPNIANAVDIKIGSSVTSIGTWAFHNCTNLTSVTIPDSITSIEFYAFMGCRELTDVMIPNSVIAIQPGAFSACNALTSMTIHDSVTYVASYVFYGCHSLKKIIIIGKTQAEAEALLVNAEVPSTCQIETWNDASQEWVNAQISSCSTAIATMIDALSVAGIDADTPLSDINVGNLITFIHELAKLRPTS